MAATVLSGAGNLYSTTSGLAGSATLNKPSATADGDYLLAFLYFRNGANTITPPAGWTLAAPANTTNETFSVYYKPIPSAAAETATSYVFTVTGGSSRMIAFIARVIGADQTTFINAAGTLAGYTGTSSVVLPAVTTTGPNKTLVAFAIANNTSTGVLMTFSPPAGSSMTTVVQGTADNGTTATAATWVGQEVVAASGSTGTRTPTISPAAQNTGGVMFAINGANTPPTVAPIATQTKTAGQTATVTAVPSDVDGTITGHAWTVYKKPDGSTVTLTGNTTATVTTNALVAGTTILQYIATDNSGQQSAPAYAKIVVPAASGVGARPEALVSNGGGWTPGGTATDLVDGLSGTGKWIIGPATPSGAEITVQMEVPSTGTHTVSFYADWLENDGSTQATGVAGSFTAQVFQAGVAISAVKSFSNTTGAPVQMSFTLLTGEEAALTDMTTITIQLKATQA